MTPLAWLLVPAAAAVLVALMAGAVGVGRRDGRARL